MVPGVDKALAGLAVFHETRSGGTLGSLDTGGEGARQVYFRSFQFSFDIDA